MARPKKLTETVATGIVATETVEKYITLSDFYTKYDGIMVVYRVGDEVTDLKPDTVKSCLEKGLIKLIK